MITMSSVIGVILAKHLKHLLLLTILLIMTAVLCVRKRMVMRMRMIIVMMMRMIIMLLKLTINIASIDEVMQLLQTHYYYS